jgi:hypothetical protein
MKLIFDLYDLKARIAPAFLLSLPLFTSLITCFDWTKLHYEKILGSSFWLFIVYALSILVRNNGNSIEPKIWESWGGLPSSIIMRWRDHKVPKELKQQYHNAVKDYLNLPLLTAEEENNDPERADELINQAFKRIRTELRSKDPKGLWSIENANYGFCRNLLGSRKLWIIITVAGTLINGYLAYTQRNSIIIGGLVANVGIFLFSIYMGWFVLPKSMKHIAFRYAENSWESFLNITKISTKVEKQSRRH